MLYLGQKPAARVKAPVRPVTPAAPVPETLATPQPVAPAKAIARAAPATAETQSARADKPAPAVGTLCGIVRDVTPEYSEDMFERLTRASSQEDFRAAFEELLAVPDRPVPNVTVTLCYGSEIRQAVTDYKGRFEFANLPFGDYTIPADGPGGLIVQGNDRQMAWTRQHVRLDSFTSGREFDITFRTDVASLKGRITDASGRPVAGAKVTGTQCQEDMEAGTPPPPHALSAVSGPDGSYELRGLIRANINETFAFLTGGASWESAHYMIRADAEGFLPARIRVPIVTETSRVPAAKVFAIVEQKVQAEGFSLSDRKPAPLPATTGDTITGIDFLLEPPASIAGQLVDEHMAPLPARAVSAVRAEERDLTNLVQDSVMKTSTETDKEGNFAFKELLSGEYSFRAKTDAGMADVEGVRVRLARGESLTGLQLVLTQQSPGRIEAFCYDAKTGGAISGLSATVYQEVESKFYGPVWGKVEMESAGPGTFRVEGIAPGKWRLEITAPGYVTEHPEVEVLPGLTAPLRIALEPAGVVHLRVMQGDVLVHLADGPTATELDTGRVSYGHAVDGDSYEITGVKPGRCKVRASIFDGKVSRLVTAPAVVEAGKTTDVTLDMAGDSALLITLSVPSGKKAWVLVTPASASGDAADGTDVPSFDSLQKDGDYCASIWAEKSRQYEYEVKPLVSGTYRVSARLLDSAKVPSGEDVQQTVILKPGETSTVNLAF